MKVVLTLFLLTGLSLIGFCGWGLFTVTGQEAFPEMAGVLPFYFGALSSRGLSIFFVAGASDAVRARVNDPSPRSGRGRAFYLLFFCLGGAPSWPTWSEITFGCASVQALRSAQDDNLFGFMRWLMRSGN